MSIMDFAASQGWAMLPERVEELANIVARENDTSPEALEAYRAKTADRAERAKVRDGVGILYVDGPLFKKANLFVSISGATSYEIMRRDLQVLAEDPNIHTILQVIDSPGGEANGCDELAAAIHDVNKTKPVVSYVSGMAASGGYWLASAAGKIIVSEAALLGSIGVVLGVQDRKAADERRGVRTIEFVSSQSPGKRPDPTTDDGRNRIQAMVDDLAEVFISAVAKYRGVSVQDVITKFGAGGMKIGAKAVASGMADEVGQLEATIASLISSGRKGRLFPQRSPGGFSMSEQNNGPTAEEIAEKAAASAQERIGAIIGSDIGKQFQPLAHHLAFKTKISATDSAAILAAAKESMPKVEEKTAQGDTEQTGAAANGNKPGDYVAHKQQTGALGAAEPPASQAAAEKVRSGWGKAVTSANTRFQ
jgi:signal peptide peptidase SppA